MNYKKIYDDIIKRRKVNPYDGYTENHHILPRCLGGSDEIDNLVKLSAKEHYICHLLLTKMYMFNTPEYHKMVHAFIFMMRGTGHTERYITSKKYEKLKIINAKHLSTTRKNVPSGMIWVCNESTKESRMIWAYENIPEGWRRGSLYGKGIKRTQETIDKIKKTKSTMNTTGENNARYGIKWYHNIELEESRKFNEKFNIPEGWLRGRVLDWTWFKNRRCPNCNSLLLTNNRKQKYCFSHECKYNKVLTTGALWVYNTSTMKQKKLQKDELIPEGYAKGKKPPKEIKVIDSNRPQKSYMWIYEIETGISKQILKNSNIDKGYKKGRIHNIEIYMTNLLYKKALANEKLLKIELENIENKIMYDKLYKIYCVHGWDGVKASGYRLSLSTFLKKCSDFVDEYKPQPGKRRK